MQTTGIHTHVFQFAALFDQFLLRNLCIREEAGCTTLSFADRSNWKVCFFGCIK